MTCDAVSRSFQRAARDPAGFAAYERCILKSWRHDWQASVAEPGAAGCCPDPHRAKCFIAQRLACRRRIAAMLEAAGQAPALAWDDRGQWLHHSRRLQAPAFASPTSALLVLALASLGACLAALPLLATLSWLALWAAKSQPRIGGDVIGPRSVGILSRLRRELARRPSISQTCPRWVT